MRINKKYFIARLLTFPLKLSFIVLFFFFMALLNSFKWLQYGSQEITYFKNEGKGDIIKLIELNKEILEQLKNQ